MASSPGFRLKIDVELARHGFRLRAKMDSQSQVVGILGPSGSGKSTFLRILAGLERQTQGKVEFKGSIWQNSHTGVFTAPWFRKVGYVPQDGLLFPNLNVFENLSFAGAIASDVEQMAERLEIQDLLKRRPRLLSGGERQRVALGRALLSSPEMILLDEPFSALDKSLKAKISEVVLNTCQERAIVLVLVSHDENDVNTFSSEAWSFHEGILSPGFRY